MPRDRGAGSSPAKRFKFVCLGCSIVGYEGGICICRFCGLDVRRMKEIERLILKRYPALRSLTTPEIFLRLWVDRLKKESPEPAPWARSEASTPELLEALELQVKIEGARGREPKKGAAA